MKSSRMTGIRRPKAQGPRSKGTSNINFQGTRLRWVLGLGIWCFLGTWNLELETLAAATPQLTASQAEFFETKIRPVLVQNCYKCHGAEATKVKGGLLLDTREGALKGGDSGPALVPGDAEKSLLIKAVRYTDPDLQMPPKGEKLSDAQIADLVSWVRMGAPDSRTTRPSDTTGYGGGSKDHWAFKPLTKVSPPQVKNDSWVK